ncbi:MAG: three-Cys-motif partner protein TcmP [Fidelibacterota bacterium]
MVRHDYKYDSDGYIYPVIGEHSLEKHKIVSYYAEMFATSMKNSFTNRVYLDLFSGAGIAEVRETDKIVETSGLLVGSVKTPFDRYIFCDQNDECLKALNHRFSNKYSDLDARYISGNTNDNVDEIISNLPSYSKSNPMLTLCLVDPFSIGNLQFSTLKSLSKFRMDMIVLLPTGMDVTRNEQRYMDDENETVIDLFLDSREWRTKRLQREFIGKGFGSFLLDEFNQVMSNIGYIPCRSEEVVTVKYRPKNVELYLLAFYSKSNLGKDFWMKTIRNTDPQENLF